MRMSLLRWCSFSLIGLCLALPAKAQGDKGSAALPKPSDLEQRLRLRCEGLYTAIQNSQWRKVEAFFNEDAKVAWAAMKKSAIYGFQITSVTVAADGKAGVTQAAVDSPMRIPGFPSTKIRTQQTVEWAWENGDWYALLKDIPTRETVPVTGPGGTPSMAEVPPEIPVPAELHFTSRVYDFKLIRKGETIHAKFFFTNKSDHAVKAKAAIFNPCNCVSAKVSKEEFKPGEDGWVEATMETKDFGGYIRQGLEVHLQPSGAKVVLQMEGYILLPWQNRDQKESPKVQ